MRTLASLLLFCSGALAQMQLLHVDAPGSEKPVSGVFAIRATPVGDRADTVFRLRNTSQASLTVRTLSLGGSGFTMFGQPSLPHMIAPGLNMDFTVRFSPRDFGSYSANLNVNGISVILTGVSTAAPVLSVNGTQMPSGSTIDLGLAERGTIASKTFRIENPTSEAVRVQSATVTGGHFRFGQPLSTPLELAPRASIDFEVAFAPAASGVFQGSLDIDGRIYKLTGAANEPPFPKPAIIVDLPNPGSGQQGRVSVKFGEASRSIGAGKLRMEFRPSSSTIPDDEAVRFMKGNRLVDFNVTEGTETAVAEATFQTGTTTGTIVFTAEVGGWTATSNVEIGPQKVHIEKSRLLRSASMLEIEITGYDNTRSVGELSFTFFTPRGDALQPGTIRVNGAADFRRYFEQSTLGGAFTLKAVFPVAGSTSDIASVEIGVTNTSGATQTGKVSAQ